MANLEWSKGKKPTWRDVVDSSKLTDRDWVGHLDNMVKPCMGVGYKLVAWNGRVYELVNESCFYDTGWLEDDLDR